MFARTGPAYAPVPGHEDDAEKAGKHPPQRPSSSLSRIAMSIAALVLVAIGFALGRWPSETNIWDVRRPRTQTVRFAYNTTFSSAPSDGSNRAWQSLTPAGRGFIQDTADGPVYGLTVFHQLHCLDMLRHAYFYASHDSKIALEELPAEHHQDPGVHARHCFDYLRQTIQCAADANREPVDVTVGGVRGWTDHVCADYDALRQWAEGHAAPGRGATM